jgi:serine protease Do
VRFTFADGKTVRGKTIGVDRDSDTGLMRITEAGNWPHASLGDLQQAHPGDWVLALGHPGGFDARRSLVVRLGRIIRLASDVLQTDCTISPGDSGGPLFDMNGRVVGIHDAISSSMAENFHVPISEFVQNWDQLAQADTKKVAERPAVYLGASGVDDPAGCRLESVASNSPASRAGLQTGDVVVKIEGRDIKASASFRRWVIEAEPGETLHLEIKRGDKVLSIEVRLEAESARDLGKMRDPGNQEMRSKRAKTEELRPSQ